MRAYCDFYEASPPDQGLLEMARTLIAEPEQGAMFIARDEDEAVGFATLGWKWSSLKAARIGYLEDLYDARDPRPGIADALIEVCAERCRERGAPAMEWLTARNLAPRPSTTGPGPSRRPTSNTTSAVTRRSRPTPSPAELRPHRGPASPS